MPHPMPSTVPSAAEADASSDASIDRIELAAGSPSERERRAVTVVISVAVVLFWLVSTSWRPWDLFDRAGFSADFYDEQARSFLRGRIAVRPEVPGPEGFVIDGKTYLYYGPFLAVVRIPLAVFGDLFVSRMVRVSMLIALVVIGRWTARLTRAARSTVLSASRPAQRTGAHTERVWPVVSVVAAAVFSPALFAAGWISVYHETEIWACALAIVSITLIAEWAAGDFGDRRRLVWGSGAVLATTLTRAPIGLGIAFGLGVIGLGLAWRSRDDAGRRGLPAIIGAVTPLAAHAVVNLAKFGTLFSVPGDRQLLSLNDPTRAAFFETTGGSFFHPGFLPTTIVQYLRPDTIRFERLVPGIRFGPLAENLGSLDVETVTPAASLPASATALVVLAIVGVTWLVRHRARTWLVLVAAGIVGAVPTFMIGFIANRYLIDMLPPLITASAIGVWIVAAADPARWRRVVGAIVLVWGAWVNASLATWALELKSPGFTELRSDVDRAVFRSGDVGTVELGPDGSLDPRGADFPRDGIVGLAPNCVGTYIAEQGRWVNLERLPGVYETSGVIDGFTEGPIRIARTSAWTVDATSLDRGGVAITFATPADPDVTTLVVDDALPFAYEIVVDPVSVETILRAGDAEVLLPRSALDSVTPTSGIGPSADIAPQRLAPLCTTLRSRSTD